MCVISYERANDSGAAGEQGVGEQANSRRAVGGRRGGGRAVSRHEMAHHMVSHVRAFARFSLTTLSAFRWLLRAVTLAAYLTPFGACGRALLLLRALEEDIWRRSEDPACRTELG